MYGTRLWTRSPRAMLSFCGDLPQDRRRIVAAGLLVDPSPGIDRRRLQVRRSIRVKGGHESECGENRAGFSAA